MILSTEAFKKLTTDDSIKFKTVLDVGAGPCTHAKAFKEKGYEVTTVDVNDEYSPDVIGDFCKIDFFSEPVPHKYDLVWCSHVLEHQTNVNFFLEKCKSLLDEEGWLCVTVPPAKHNIVGGHFSLWNGGLLLYNLVMAGFDCSKAKLLRHDYNITVIVQNKTAVLPPLNYDYGDIKKLNEFFPTQINPEDGFNGDIISVNWDNVPFDLSALAGRYKGTPICIVGNGPTAHSNETVTGKGDFSDYGMPIWVCNGTFIYHPTAEMCWMMDDIKGPAADAHESPEWYRNLIKNSHIPVISCQSYDDYPSIIEYPLREVISTFNKQYFTETVNYAVAWAIMIGVSEIHLHGCDYIGCRPSERAGMEYWLGRAEERGIKTYINNDSMLLKTDSIDNVNMHVQNLYGYLEEPEWLIKAKKVNNG